MLQHRAGANANGCNALSDTWLVNSLVSLQDRRPCVSAHECVYLRGSADASGSPIKELLNASVNVRTSMTIQTL